MQQYPVKWRGRLKTFILIQLITHNWVFYNHIHAIFVFIQISYTISCSLDQKFYYTLQLIKIRCEKNICANVFQNKRRGGMISKEKMG